MRTLSTSKKAAYVAATVLGLSLGGAGIATAATHQATPIPSSTASAPGQAKEQGKEQGKETNDANDAQEQQESAALAAKAKVTPSEAQAAATKAVPGTAGTPTLENENGAVVYGVEVTTKSGIVDVKVDAVTGKVLSQESGQAEGSDGTDKAETGDKGDKADKGADTPEPGDTPDVAGSTTNG